MNKKAILAKLLCRTGLAAFFNRIPGWSGLLVFNYHRVGDGQGSLFDKGLWSATPEGFAEQLRLFKEHLEMITPDDLPRVLASGRGRYGMVTFDDGYRDNYEVAFPILKSEKVRAAFFVTTGFLDDPRVPWWDEIAWMVRTSRRDRIELPGWLPAPLPFDGADRQQAIEALLRVYRTLSTDATAPFLEAIAGATGSGRCDAGASRDLWMTWDMVREMCQAGMCIGGHTVSHPILAKVSRELQRQEIMGCAIRLAEEVGESMQYFSYPGGKPLAFNNFTRDIMREAGVRYAFSYYNGFRRWDDWDDYDVRRVAVESEMTPDWFRSLVSMPGLFA